MIAIDVDLPKNGASCHHSRQNKCLLGGCSKISYPFGQNFQNSFYEAEIFGSLANVEFFNMG